MNIQANNTGLNNMHLAAPVQVQERIEIIDIVRGFALFGILISNMILFSGATKYFDILGKNISIGFLDSITVLFIKILIVGKFYNLFAFLFGLGFAIFFERAKTKVNKPTLLFYKRLFILLLIGLAHAFFIWSGDVLVTYALFGFLLPLFFKLKPETILILAILIIIIFLLSIAFDDLSMLINSGTNTDNTKQLFEIREIRIESSLRAYGQGTFSEIMSYRISETLLGYRNIFVQLIKTFPLFLFGLYIGKRVIFQNIEENIALIKKTLKWSLGIGLVMVIVKHTYKNLMTTNPFYNLIGTGSYFLESVGLCIFFMTIIILLYRNGKWALRFKPLAYMGRMALSNYLFQSIVCTTIFYSYGLGLYGKVGPALGLFLTVVILTVQLFISKYWLKRYQFGPLEWIWKSLTYGKIMRNKIAQNSRE